MANLLILNFEGVDEATTWTEEAQSLSVVSSTDCQIDTAQYFSGSSSLLMQSFTETSLFDYIVPGINSLNFLCTLYFRHSSIDDGWIEIQFTDADGDSYLDVNLEEAGWATYLYDKNGTTVPIDFVDGRPSIDAWHKLEISVFGQELVIALDDVIIVAETLVTTDALNGIDYFLVAAGGGTSPPIWVDAITVVSNVYNETLSDTFGLSEIIQVLLNGKMDEVIEDGFSLVDLMSELYFELIEESLNEVDLIVGRFLKGIADSLVLNSTSMRVRTCYDTLAGSLVFTDINNPSWIKRLLESMMIYDRPSSGWHVSVPEALTLTDTIRKLLGLIIPDVLPIKDSQINMWHGQEILNQALGIYDYPKDIQLYAKLVEESLVATDLPKYRLVLTVLEYLGFTDAVSGVKSFIQSIAEAMSLTDGASRGFDRSISESLVSTDAASVIGVFLESISESLVSTDSVSHKALFGKTIAESLVISETVLSKGKFRTVVQEALALNVTVELSGEIWQCYVLNTPKFYPSIYSGFDFNSYAVFDNRAFGANDTGIYELAGTSDAGSTIRTGVVLSETDFGSPNQKRFRKGYIGISGTTPVMVFEASDGQREAYSIDTQGRVTASSDLKGRSWKLSVADFDTLDSLNLIPVILTR